MEITIIGTNCILQEELKNNVEDIIRELGLECKLKIVHRKEIIKIDEEKYIPLTPALVVDDIVLCQGHIWPKDQIKQFLLKRCKSNKQPVTIPAQFAKWKGIPREEIDWHPIIDENKCVGCGMCVTSCGRNVFDFNIETKKAVVSRPLQCMVGCTSCEVWCIYNAIRFPDKQIVRDFIKNKKILAKAKKELEEKLK